MVTTKEQEAKARGASKWTADQKRDFEAIRKRADSLSKKLKAEDFDRNGNPVDGPWAKMLADFNAWARKYKVEVKTTEREDRGGKPGTGTTPMPMSIGSCPALMHSTEKVDFADGSYFNTETTCTLKRRTWIGRCVYSCVTEFAT